MTTEIVVLTKAPIPGQVKTRLIPDLGAEAAAKLHWEMAWATLERATKTGFPVRVSLAGDTSGHDFTTQLVEAGYPTEPQADGDLGQRMAHVLQNPGRQIILGTDCVVFEPEWLHLAANSAADIAIGPATDGGYWSISVNGVRPDLTELLFDGIQWSTDTVFSTTTSRLERSKSPYTLLPKAYDIDALHDVKRLYSDPRCSPRIRRFLSSIFQT